MTMIRSIRLPLYGRTKSSSYLTISAGVEMVWAKGILILFVGLFAGIYLGCLSLVLGNGNPIYLLVFGVAIGLIESFIYVRDSYLTTS